MLKKDNDPIIEAFEYIFKHLNNLTKKQNEIIDVVNRTLDRLKELEKQKKYGPV